MSFACDTPGPEWWHRCVTPSIREAAGAVPPTVGGATQGFINSVPKAGKTKISSWDTGSCSLHGSGRCQGLEGEPGLDSSLASPRTGEAGIQIPPRQN